MSTNGHSAGTAVLERVREALAEAAQNGDPEPGRNVLARQLGVKPHLVRQAKEVLRHQPAILAPASATTPTGSDMEAPTEPAATEPHKDLADGTGQPGASPGDLAPASPPARRFATLAAWIRQQPWALLLMGVAAGFSVWSGWVGLGAMAGFGPVQPLPGIWDSLTINSAIVLPISVEAYGAYALRKWLTPGYSRRTSIYAGISSVASLVVGGAAQVAYHLLKAYGYTRAPWQVVTAVALVPVVVLTLAAILAKLVSVDRQAGASQ